MTARKHSTDEATLLKGLLLDRIAGGTMLSDAAAELHISWRTLAIWQREDDQFADDLDDAQVHLADVMAARAVKAHELQTDPKKAQVLQRGAQWIAEKLHPKRYGQRVEVKQTPDGTELVELMRQAIARLELHQQANAAKTIDLTPQRRPTGTSPQELQELHKL